MEEWDTYSLIDFMPMEPEVYLRLFVRQNQDVWPFQFVTIGLALAAAWLAWRGRSRPVGPIMGAAFVWVGYSFFLDMYAELNWAAAYIGWAFVAQGIATAAYGVWGRLDFDASEHHTRFGMSGFGLVGMALVGYPFWVRITGRSWEGVELVGTAPDPTAVMMLGLVVAAREIPWPLVVIPCLWCLYSGATSLAMGWAAGLLSPVLAVAAIALAIGKAASRES